MAHYLRDRSIEKTIDLQEIESLLIAFYLSTVQVIMTYAINKGIIDTAQLNKTGTSNCQYVQADFLKF